MCLRPPILYYTTKLGLHQYSKLLEKGFQLLIGTLNEEVGGKQTDILMLLFYSPPPPTLTPTASWSRLPTVYAGNPGYSGDGKGVFLSLSLPFSG